MAAAVLDLLITAKNEASGPLNEVGKSADGIGGKLKGLAMAAAGAFAAIGATAAIKNAVDDTQALGDSVFKLQQITGMTAEKSSDMIFAFKEVGIDADAAGTMLGRFTKNMFAIQVANEDGSQPNKTTAQLLKDIGVQALDASGHLRPVPDLLTDVAAGFKASGDPARNAATAMALFGKSGLAMLPYLNKGADGIAEMSAEAKKLGLELSGENVDAIHKYTMEQRTMGEAIGGLKLQIGLALMPELTKMSTWFVEHQPTIREFLHSALEKIGEVVGTISDAITKAMPTFESFAQTMKVGFDVIKPALEWVLNNKAGTVAAFTAIGIAGVLAFTPITLPILAVMAALVGLVFVVGLVHQHWDEIKATTIAVWTEISDFMHARLGFLIDILTYEFESAKNIVITAFNVVRDIFTIAMAVIHGDWGAAWGGIKQLVSDVWAGISTEIGLRIELIKNLLGDAWSAITWVAAAGWNAFKGAIGDAIDWIVGKIDDLISKITSIPSPGDLLGGIGSGLKHGLGFAAGTDFVPQSGAYLVGEKGREIVWLPRGAAVTPADQTRQMLSQGAQGGSQGGGAVTNHYYIQELHVDGDAAAGLMAAGASVR